MDPSFVAPFSATIEIPGPENQLLGTLTPERLPVVSAKPPARRD